MPSLTQALRQTTRLLAEAGLPEPGMDARVLLCEAAGIERIELISNGGAPLPRRAEADFDGFVARRLRREPVSRILGRREFWGLDLLVTPDVLDPRADTEALVEAVLLHVGDCKAGALRILDLGTGSGAILCALMSELPAAQGWGVDRSLAACHVARKNVTRHGFAGRSLILQGDWAAGVAPDHFDLIVANPPYIETAIIATLEADVRDHDPLSALDGGADGLVAYRAIAAQLPSRLKPGGAVYLEVGFDQAEAVCGLLAAAGLARGQGRRDLAGVERVVSATRHH